jgi:polyisoprenoid-binding protein YceI
MEGHADRMSPSHHPCLFDNQLARATRVHRRRSVKVKEMPIQNRRWLVAVVCALAMLGRVGADEVVREFRVDAAASQVTVLVGRTGAFGFAGHDHEVAVPKVDGIIVLDSADATQSTITLRFDVTAMKVTGRGEPAADVPEVQRVMLSDRVLDAQRYPTITFTSRRIVIVKQAVDRLVLRVEGDLTLHGVTRPITVPVEVRLADDQLAATANATVRQTDFGIRPVTAGAGTVRVKDELELAFRIVAR